MGNMIRDVFLFSPLHLVTVEPPVSRDLKRKGVSYFPYPNYFFLQNGRYSEGGGVVPELRT